MHLSAEPAAASLKVLLIAFAALGAACAATEARAPKIPVTSLAPLPEPLSNNAVALLPTADGDVLVSALGLRAGKSWADTTSGAWMLDAGAQKWRRLPDVPGDEGRLAAAAVAAAGRVFIIGGYTVAEDGAEKSIETLHALDPATGEYERLADMPVPVDDAVLVARDERWLYLVSGWHDTGNVNLVQLYDIENDRWRQATPYPGPAVFGHAGGLVDATLVICDGVTIAVYANDKRSFEASPACYRGEIDAADPARIDWYAMPRHPGAPLYRMAAAGVPDARQVVFAGGSDNPYNYDGLGYNGSPSQPSDLAFAWNVDERRWQEIGRLATATMDHRALLVSGDGLVIVGGMRAGQQVSDTVLKFRLP
ncbi:MAG: galactose oxidase [Pseudomonadota bacterium]